MLDSYIYDTEKVDNIVVFFIIVKKTIYYSNSHCYNMTTYVQN